MSRGTLFRLATLLAAGLSAATVPASPAPHAQTPAAAHDEFFIVSSIDLSRGTMVLKRPTEVTLAMRVTGKTRCAGEDGKPIPLADLRAGDTLYIVAEADASGVLVASRIRRGPMTVPELHRRYLRF